MNPELIAYKVVPSCVNWLVGEVMGILSVFTDFTGTLGNMLQVLYTNLQPEYKLGECRTLWGECERAVTKSNLSSYSG